MCWPDVPAGVVAKQPCPTYIHGSNLGGTEYGSNNDVMMIAMA